MKSLCSPGTSLSECVKLRFHCDLPGRNGNQGKHDLFSCFQFSISADVPLTLEIAPPGCSSGLLLRDADLPPVQLERSRWITGVCVSGGHTGFSSLHWWKQDFGHPQSTPAPAYATPTQVGTASGIYVGCEVQETSYVISSSCDLRSVCAGLHPCLACAFFFQGDQPRPWIKAGRGDAHHLSEAHRQYCPYLLRLLHRLWHLRSAGAFSHKVMSALNGS